PGITASSWFTLKEGVKWYGGFAGNENSLHDRDLAKIHTLNETILTGNNTSYHVLYNTAPLTNAVVIDGFTISGGKTASGNTGANYYGGGFYNTAGSPVLSNLLFKNNTGYYGGGMYNAGSPTLKNVTFLANKAGLQGGAF